MSDDEDLHNPFDGVVKEDDYDPFSEKKVRRQDDPFDGYFDDEEDPVGDKTSTRDV